MDPKQIAQKVTVYINKNNSNLSDTSFTTGDGGDARTNYDPAGFTVEYKSGRIVFLPWTSISHIVGVPID